MELVFAALIWNADAVAYVPMSRAACFALRRDRFHVTKPLVECVTARWNCDRGWQLVEDR